MSILLKIFLILPLSVGNNILRTIRFISIDSIHLSYSSWL